MSRHDATLALAQRLRIVDPRRYRSLASDLAALGGDLVTETPALSVLDRLIGEVERLTAEVGPRMMAEKRAREDLERLKAAVRKVVDGT